MLEPKHIDWLGQQFNHPCIHFQRLSGGKNNSVWSFESGQSQYVLKHYYDDEAQRCKRETQFVKLLNDFNSKWVPKLVSCDENEHIAVFEFFDGAPPIMVDRHRCLQAANFVAELNSPEISSAAKLIMPAKGCLVSAQDFFDDVSSRIKRLASIQIKTAIDEQCVQFVTTKILPLYSHLQETYLPILQRNNFIKVLSPSDFGFHNCLVRDEYIQFIDFEYAGWDSAEKLITDFWAQPRFQLNDNVIPEFIAQGFESKYQDLLLSHIRLLLPLCRLKWCLIFLNEFLDNDVLRRNFSHESAVNEVKKKEQLCKSVQKFKDIEVKEY